MDRRWVYREAPEAHQGLLPVQCCCYQNISSPQIFKAVPSVFCILSKNMSTDPQHPKQLKDLSTIEISSTIPSRG
jgi:hypothetical protein